MGHLDSAFIIIGMVLLCILIALILITLNFISPGNAELSEQKKDKLNALTFLGIPCIWTIYALHGVGFRINFNLLFILGVPLTFGIIRYLYRKSVKLTDGDQRRKSLMWTSFIMFLCITLLYYPVAWTQESWRYSDYRHIDYQPMVHLCLLGFLTMYIGIGGYLNFKSQLKKEWLKAFSKGSLVLLFPIGFIIINAITCSGWDCSIGDALGVIAILLILIVVIITSIIVGYRNRPHV